MGNVLVTGCNGQLGREIKELSKEHRAFCFYFTDIGELDIASLKQVESFVQEKKVDYIINCAAYTNVDQAEKEEAAAYAVNADAVKNIAVVASGNNVTPIHISTDYVFSGEGFVPYAEWQETSPKGIYGKSKLQGEDFLRSVCPNHIIIRTSWLYSPFGKNFLTTMMSLGKERKALDVVVDQVGSPTYAHDLAKAILHILSVIEDKADFNEFGTYHYSNEGVCSWYDFAVEIQSYSKNQCLVNAVGSKHFKSLASRPHYSVLDKSKIKDTFGLEIPHWRGRIKHCIERVNKM